ncbi:MAG: PQQ-binding-like beta-propeller repeat protein [Planctomycetota bacterium]
MLRYRALSLCVACLALVATSTTTPAMADWPQFLGPAGNNVSEETGLPTTWSSTENIVWKTAMPGFGTSSPIIVGDRIFLTAYSGYATDPDNPGKIEDLRHHVIALDRKTGKILWDQSTQAVMPEQKYGGFIALHGYASGTLASDGKMLFAFFGKSGVLAYTVDGKPVWRANVGDKTHAWGSGTSPILVDDLVVVNASVESGSLVALNKNTGKEVWSLGGVARSWSTPAVLTLPSGQKEIVVSLENEAWGVDSKSGKKLWSCAAVPDYVCPAVVTHGDVAYVTGGRKPVAIAVRGGGKGDVTSTHRLWEVKETPKVPSPVYYEGRLYWVSDTGTACCLEAETGKTVFEKRLSGLGKVYATILIADGKMYVVSRENGAAVFAVGAELKELAANDLGDKSVFNASPVADNGQLLLRSDKFLYCIGK